MWNESFIPTAISFIHIFIHFLSGEKQNELIPFLSI